MPKVRYEAVLVAAYAIVIGLSLVETFADSYWSDRVFGLQLLAVGILLGVSSSRLPLAERRHLQRTLSVVIIASAAIVFWIAFQLLPIPQLSNPIWKNASVALGRSLPPLISIDPLATILYLFHVILYAGILFLGAIISVDRLGARSTSFVIITISLLSSVFAYVLSDNNLWRLDIFYNLLSISVIMLVGLAYLLYERSETRAQDPFYARRAFVGSGVSCVCVAALSAILFYGSTSLRIETAVAVATAALIAGGRRVNSPKLVVTAGLAFFGGALIMLLDTRAGRPSSLILSLVNASPDQIRAFDRMLADAPLVGTGAGSFSTLADLYLGEAGAQKALAPSKLASFVVELGWPAVLIIALGLGLLFAQTLFGSMTRGRDAAYPLTTFAILILLVLASLSEPDISCSIISTLVAAQIGLGLVQARGRR